MVQRMSDNAASYPTYTARFMIVAWKLSPGLTVYCEYKRVAPDFKCSTLLLMIIRIKEFLRIFQMVSLPLGFWWRIYSSPVEAWEENYGLCERICLVSDKMLRMSFTRSIANTVNPPKDDWEERRGKSWSRKWHGRSRWCKNTPWLHRFKLFPKLKKILQRLKILKAMLTAGTTVIN